MAVMPTGLRDGILAAWQAADAQADFPKLDIRRVTATWGGSDWVVKIKLLIEEDGRVTITLQRRHAAGG